MAQESVAPDKGVEDLGKVYGYIVSSLDLIDELGKNVDSIIKNEDYAKLEELTKEQLKRLNVKDEIIKKLDIDKILYDYFYVKLERIQSALDIISNMPEKLIKWADSIKTNINFDDTNIDLCKHLDEINICLHFYFKKDQENKYVLHYTNLTIKNKDGNEKAYIDIYTDNNLKMISSTGNYFEILELAYRLL